MTLTDFLLARIAEDEADRAGVLANLRNPQPMRDNIKRGLVECEAKRRIVDRAAQWHAGADAFEDGYDTAMEEACQFLALPYADHPEYREEWKP